MGQLPIQLYDLVAPARPRWVAGDQYPRALLRALLRPWRGRPPGGLAKVTRNLCRGLEQIGQPYILHTKPVTPPPGTLVGILHGPPTLVRQVATQSCCVTGVGVLDFPDQWPALFTETRAAFHLQACEWAAAYYRPFFGDRVRIWPVGIETAQYTPRPEAAQEFDFLVYDKLRWPAEHPEPNVLARALAELDRRGLKYFVIGYGRYPKGRENAYHALLARSRAVLFLCENETQGIAYNEALSMNVPLLAWDPGRWLDPARHKHGLSECPATSVPYFDARCGERFRNLSELPHTLDLFLGRLRNGVYRPRDYVLEHLELGRCARRYVELLREASGKV
jgi:glycosyltransferase involved in cell wall biosynthesis